MMSLNRAYLKVLFGETHGILTFKLTEKSATNPSTLLATNFTN
jgi:hypothetical protein